MPTVLMLAAALCTTFSGSLAPVRSNAEDVDPETEDTESVSVTDESSVSFSRDIRPLLSNRCFACHGPDAGSREGGLRLDQPDGDEGAIGYSIEPHSAEDSEVWHRITADDESMLMPPPDSHLEPFNEEETELIRRWIVSGAVYEDFWAFRVPERPQPPVTQNAEWSAQTVDQFVLRKLESQQRRPSEEADARTLLRRVTFDLTGLPPSREAIRQFESAYANSPELAWEELIVDLLSRPQFGEHIARHWLDLVRFADTNGMHKDFYRNHVAYRDWVIRSFNDNLPYDEFVRDQIAGDLYPQPTKDQLIASGFNRLHLIIDRGTALPEESHVKNVLDRVTAVGTAFMGLTVQCAQCHDHKFDPITQKDFFSLYAFFNNIDAEPETNPRKVVDGFQEPFARFPTDAQQAELDRLDAELAKLDQRIRSEEKPTNQPEEKLKSRLESLKKQRRQVQRDRDAVERSVEKAMVMKERDEVRKTFVLIRGQYDAPGEEVQRGVPGSLPPLKTRSETPSRMDLANWMVAPENPLTARVAVNRFWQLFFGVGLVKTSEDFGNQGEVPSHPELLDELAVPFVESGWDVKALLKRIVMSKTYRQSSRATPDEFKADAENRLLSRGPRYRLDAEMIRDQILFSSGLLSTRMHGPSVKPPQPDGLWKAVSMTGERFRPDQGESIYRRSIYTFWKRAMPPPQMTILNAPNRDACIARRERTNTPTQALLLLNESEYLRAAGQLAQSTLAEPAEDRILFAYETVTAKLPDSKEVDVLQTLLNDLRDEYASSPKLVDDLCEGVSVDSPQDKVELAAWTVLCNTLYNLDITKTKD
ncbi:MULTISPECIES: DUF1553 domain-containing protein [Rhodopirellula]|uniref:DUF1553 domain-containing protein n=1 Tax=Rhodopirellula TaxID=265488 RepID=UPI00257F1366|nr:DUF1553 domain-containing protein [Rhodopirellula sp. UBA1907]